MNKIHIPGLKCGTGLRARLLLEDDLAIEGCGFGSQGLRVGEAVFSSSVIGYSEALTDPSYTGQILVWTHPMVGSYGAPSIKHSYSGIPLNYESERMQAEGFIVSEITSHNHHLSVSSLDEWLRSNDVPGMYKVDTRALVKRIREHGVLKGVLAVYPEGEDLEWSFLEKKLKESESYDSIDFTERVSPKDIIVHKPQVKPIARISILDCGVKYGILRSLLKQGFEITRFPCSSKAGDLLEGFNGVVISNGPGNPAILERQIKIVEDLVYSGKPLLGVCLGMQLISLALGARSYKLKYGHRGSNKGVIELYTGKSFITIQNHGHAIDEKSLENTGLDIWFKNIDDGTVEGVKHRTLPVIATQFHPEGNPGPTDTAWVFEMFTKMVLKLGNS